jgi:hypothetical protein
LNGRVFVTSKLCGAALEIVVHKNPKAKYKHKTELKKKKKRRLEQEGLIPAHPPGTRTGNGGQQGRNRRLCIFFGAEDDSGEAT